MSNVFISHRGADIVLAEKLALSLKIQGNHNVWLDAWKINIGDSIVDRINNGLTGRIALILCLSSIGSSPWMDVEWMSTLGRQLQGESVKILPARLTGGTLPPILADRMYADLGSDWDSGVRKLLEALK